MNTPTYTITNDSVTVILEGKVIAIRRGAPNFDASRAAVLAEQWDGIENILVPGHAVSQWLGDGFTFEDGAIRFDGDSIDTRLSDRMVKMSEAGDNPLALMKFWRRLQSNPSMRSVDQLYGFLENKGIPIDAEGYILAYKSINSEYKDHHTGTCDNTVGQVLAMPRNRISDDPNQACHYGYHVGALEYARTFGASNSRIVVCRVDPADVVCVPYDHSMQKVRVCRYEVMSEQERPEFLSDTYEDVEPEGVDWPEDEEDEYMSLEEDEDMSLEDMHECTLATLRTYAKSIGIKRVNNIIGGKAALILAVLKARGL